MGQCPTGTPVFGFGRTYMSLWQLCHSCGLKDDAGRPDSIEVSVKQKLKIKKTNLSQSNANKWSQIVSYY